LTNIVVYDYVTITQLIMIDCVNYLFSVCMVGNVLHNIHLTILNRNNLIKLRYFRKVKSPLFIQRFLQHRLHQSSFTV